MIKGQVNELFAKEIYSTLCYSSQICGSVFSILDS